MPEHQQTQQSKRPEPSTQRRIIPTGQTYVSHPYSIIQRARTNPKSLTSADVLQLQRTIGNRAVGRLLSEIRNPSKFQQVPIQRQKLEEEETCPSCVQRQETPDEEEPLQGKMIGTAQRQEIPEEEEPLQPKRKNNTGMPDNLKAGVESLSGIDMSDVRVHFNSNKPTQIGALAYTQGIDIHVAPGQESHLPHEAWHVVQQAQGRVWPTMQLKGGRVVNDDKSLEHEASMMGDKISLLACISGEKVIQLQALLSSGTQIIQCTLEVSENNHIWTLKGRPNFLPFVKQTLVSKYNQEYGTTYNASDISLTDEELDQCHKISWDNIRDFVSRWLNQNVKDADFRTTIEILYNYQVTPEETLTLQDVDNMISEKSQGNLQSDRVVTVCTRLNSATPNLRLDDSHMNRRIKQHFDPHLERSHTGTHLSASPVTRRLAESEMVSMGVKYSKSGTSGFSSSVGEFQRSDLSPRTGRLKAFK